MTRHLRNLGNRLSVSLPVDKEGYLGRECPDPNCEHYFKIKPGTGLKGLTLPCHCPYCGYKGPMNHFHSRSQIDYAASVAKRKVHEAISHDLEDMARDFNRRTQGGLFSIKMKVESSSSPLSHFTEKELETNVECGNCTLQYSVYGVFAFCPDCGQHNSLQILDKNLELVGKILDLSAGAEVALAERLIENALEDCVSAFDGFGREVCRVYAKFSANPAKAEKISFQNLDSARQNVMDSFAFNLADGLALEEWKAAVQCFQKRHLVSHKMGVVDDDYIQKSGDTQAVVGRKISIGAQEVRSLVQILGKLARYTSNKFPMMEKNP